MERRTTTVLATALIALGILVAVPMALVLAARLALDWPSGYTPRNRPTDREWCKLREGMAEAEVEELLGRPSSGVTGWFAEYGYYSDWDVHGPDPKAYVIWYDSSNRVARWRKPLEGKYGAAPAPPRDGE